MAQAMASMAGLHATSQAVLEGSLQLRGSNRFSKVGSSRIAVSRSSSFALAVRAQQVSTESEAVTQSSRRAMLGLVAAGLATGSFVQAVLAEPKPIKVGPPPPPSVQPVLAEPRPIKVGPPPPPSGGLPGTENSDEARDFDLPLKKRFYLQSLPPTEAAVRAKESAQEILTVKEYIDKKAWPYVQNDLRNKAGYLRFDLNTIISSKPKDEKKLLKDLTGKLFENIDNLDHAAKIKSSTEANKYYASTISALKDVLAKIG